jgi:hypothetical protein
MSGLAKVLASSVRFRVEDNQRGKALFHSHRLARRSQGLGNKVRLSTGIDRLHMSRRLARLLRTQMSGLAPVPLGAQLLEVQLLGV